MNLPTNSEGHTTLTFASLKQFRGWGDLFYFVVFHYCIFSCLFVVAYNEMVSAFLFVCFFLVMRIVEIVVVLCVDFSVSSYAQPSITLLIVMRNLARQAETAAGQPLQQDLGEGGGTGPVERRNHHQAAKKKKQKKNETLGTVATIDGLCSC